MKRLLLLGFSLLLVAVSTACGLKTTEPAVTTTTGGGPIEVEGVAITGDAERAEIDILAFSSPEFVVMIETIDIDYVLGRITVDITVSDFEYENFVYLAVARPVDMTGPHMESWFTMTSRLLDHTITIDAIDSSETYEFLVGRVDKDAMSESVATAAAVAGFTIRLPRFQMTSHIGWADFDFPYEFDFNEPYSPIGASTAEIDIEFFDSDAAVTAVEVRFMVAGKQTVVGTVTAAVDAVPDSHGKRTVAGLFVEGLAPGVDYDVELYASGNDGEDDFEDILFGRSVYTGHLHSGMLRYEHGFYGYVEIGRIVETGYAFNAFYVNDDVKVDGAGSPLAFVLRVRDDGEELLAEYPLEAGVLTPFVIPNALLDFDTTFHVESVSGLYELGYELVRYAEPTLEVGFKNHTGTSRTITFEYHAGSCTIVGGYVEVSYLGEVIDTYGFEEWSSSPYVELALDDGPVDYVWLDVRVVLEYALFDGHAVAVDDVTGRRFS